MSFVHFKVNKWELSCFLCGIILSCNLVWFEYISAELNVISLEGLHHGTQSDNGKKRNPKETTM